MSFCKTNHIEGFFVYRDAQGTAHEADQWATFATSEFPLAPVKAGLVVNEGEPHQSIWPSLLGAIIIFGLAILGMAVGTIVGNKPIQGSCGGLSAKPGEEGETSCSVCHDPVTECADYEDQDKTAT